MRLTARKADERLLRILRLRVKGWSTTQIAAKVAASQGNVTMWTNAVRDADLAESGEPAAVVRAAYDWGRR